MPERVRKIRERTPARLFMGRAGTSYRTSTQIVLREAHARARDAVRDELDMARDFGALFIGQWDLFEVSSRAANKDEYLLRPDLGRTLSQPARSEVVRRCLVNADLQITIGDGLSVTAVRAQVPNLLPLLSEGAKQRGWSVGRPFVVRHCRVGVLNEIGELLKPKVAVLLIGERPGLATAESLSAYMAYEPTKSHTDRDRNLISNIHARGVRTNEGAGRILELAAQMMLAGTSGYTLRELPLGLE
ncbi:MAG: ethanolamine ammonia-lyase subunit EutC [Acidobacteria bacterium]|nr:ethanolamine ammonia-lyase subunit EutC [Acidobacteriota bacterium]